MKPFFPGTAPSPKSMAIPPAAKIPFATTMDKKSGKAPRHEDQYEGKYLAGKVDNPKGKTGIPFPVAVPEKHHKKGAYHSGRYITKQNGFEVREHFAVRVLKKKQDPLSLKSFFHSRTRIFYKRKKWPLKGRNECIWSRLE